MLNAAAPLLTALFANSRVYEGAAAGARSVRARSWRELDPARTGLLGRGADPAGEYLDFALRRAGDPAGREGEPPLPFAEWLPHGGVGEEDWWTHLTTLFPEVRPKGYVEVRSLDAISPEWFAAPLVLLTGLVYHRESLREAAGLLGAPEPELLVRAGEAGLGDPRLARGSVQLFEIGLRGAAALGEGFVDGESLETARDFLARYTARGRSPGDDFVEALGRARRSA